MKEQVLKILKCKELKAGEIAELLGADKKEVEKAIKALKDEDKIISPKRCFYTAK